MKTILTNDPDVLELKEDATGCLTLIGALVGVWGGCVSLAGLGVIKVVEDQPWYFYTVVLVIGVLILTGGLLFILHRSGMVIDRRAGTVMKWSGPMFALRKWRFQLSSYNRVHYHLNEEDADMGEILWLDLAGDPGLDPLNITVFMNEAEGAPLAEELSRFLNLPLDKTVLAAPTEESPEDEC